jgi:hypothetical protein
MLRIVRGLVVTLMLVLAVTAPASAKGPPQHIAITGPWLAGPIEVTDAEVIARLDGLENIDSPAQRPPASIEAVYVITRSMQDGNSYRAFDQILYVVPGPGGPGLVYYVGIHNGWGPYDGKWYAVRPGPERALLELLQAPRAGPGVGGVDLPPARPGSAHAQAARRAESDPAGIVALGARGLLILGGVVVLRGRRPG